MSAPRRTTLACLAAALGLAAVTTTAYAAYKEKFLERSKAWGSAVADFDNDGKQDIWVTGHDDNDRVWFWNGKAYVAGPQVFESVDRHDCDAADVDHDGWIDLYCEIGGEKGTAHKANELYMNNHDHTFTLAQNHGAEDPTGRGRIPLFFDLDHDGWPDIYDAVEATDRVDGEPNINHIYVNNHDKTFHEVVTIATGKIGSQCVAKGDVNGDGWDDLLICNEKGPARIFLNNKHNDFVDLNTPAIGVEWRDAKLVDLNGDKKDDLVFVTDTAEVYIYLNTGVAPYFVTPAFHANLPGFRANAITVGDFNQDKAKDVYIVMADKDCETTLTDAAPDVVLWGTAAGNAWTMETLSTQAFAGCGHLADTVDGFKVLLENGGVGYRGPEYILNWK